MTKPPDPPEHLEPATAAWWSEVVAEYQTDAHNVRLLTLAAEAWDRGQEARQALASHGLTYLDRFEAPRCRPEVAIERDSRLAFARLIAALDLDESPPVDGRTVPRVGKPGGTR